MASIPFKSSRTVLNSHMRKQLSVIDESSQESIEERKIINDMKMISEIRRKGKLMFRKQSVGPPPSKVNKLDRIIFLELRVKLHFPLLCRVLRGRGMVSFFEFKRFQDLFVFSIFEWKETMHILIDEVKISASGFLKSVAQDSNGWTRLPS